jgi:hypothetical protein
MIRLLSFILAATPIAADPLFENRSAGLPDHIYGGGWEHFVGGGVAVFDCNDDTLPDLFAAGGENPAKLMINQGDFVFADGALPKITGVTGAYPLDVDADGILDLFVLRVGQNRLLMGNGDCAFTPSDDLPQDDAWSTAFTAWWEDDGKPVMAVGNYVDRSNPEGPFGACDDNAILRAGTGGYQSTPLTPGFCPLSMLAAVDARGRTALRISNDRHYYIRDGYEQMWDIE